MTVWETLNLCALGARWIFREFVRLYPDGFILMDDAEMERHFNVCNRTLRAHLGDLRRHRLLRRGRHGDCYYIPTVVSGKFQEELICNSTLLH